MSRYRKSIHQALAEVGEWQPPTEPEVLIEEAPIPTETGRELLKKRIAHSKVEKKELKYYPMGDVFRGKLQKTTEHLKEALELDEIDEAVKWEVKVSGLPVFYSDGKSKGAVRQMLRKLLKHPDDIQSINRVTSAELKKIRRGQIAGDEPGDEDEDKSPVGPSYNEGTGGTSVTQAQIDDFKAKGGKVKKIPSKPQSSHQTPRAKSDSARYNIPTGSSATGAGKHWGAYKRTTDKRNAAKAAAKAAKKEGVELDEAGRPRGAARIENERFWDLKDKELHYIIKDAGQAVQANPTSKKATQGPGNWSDQINDAATVLYYRKKKKIKVEGFEGPFTAPGSGSIAKQRKAKASDTNKSIEQQVADARKESLAFQENEWDSMWKNAAKSKPKMSFKQATAFVDEVGLDKKEKTDALKTAKKWLK